MLARYCCCTGGPRLSRPHERDERQTNNVQHRAEPGRIKSIRSDGPLRTGLSKGYQIMLHTLDFIAHWGMFGAFGFFRGGIGFVFMILFFLLVWGLRGGGGGYY